MIHLFKAHYLLAVICLRLKYQGTKELSSQALPNDQMVCTEYIINILQELLFIFQEMSREQSVCMVFS